MQLVYYTFFISNRVAKGPGLKIAKKSSNLGKQPRPEADHKLRKQPKMAEKEAFSALLASKCVQKAFKYLILGISGIKMRLKDRKLEVSKHFWLKIHKHSFYLDLEKSLATRGLTRRLELLIKNYVVA